ncbi:porin [Marinimicrobium alkaliphilum]|uniref:porin n=1 Tax=Marinimicrobium alkaliphilum TaxID=2202654 RepID=UPI000DB8FB63|nr:porin [Marinimicrobium alkaliphilum]
MKKMLLPLALVGVMPAVQAADVQVYGYIHVALELLDDGNDYSELNMASRASNLGFRANRDLGNYTLLAQLEQGVDMDTGTAFTVRRNTFVGLRGDFGMVRVGHFDTPFKAARGPANLFPNQLGDIRSITRVPGSAAANGQLDERTSNTLAYQTPRFGDLQFDIAYSMNQGSRVEDGEDSSVVSFAANYRTDSWHIAGAYEAWGEDAGGGEREGLRLAASYQLNADMRLMGFYQNVSHDVDDAYTSDTLGGGAVYRLNQSTDVRGTLFYRAGELDDSDSMMLVVGVNHALAQGLYTYANLGITNNDDSAALTPWRVPTTANPPGSAGDTATGLSAGLVYRF